MEIEDRASEQALGAGFDQGAGGFVHGGIGQVPVLDEDGKRQIVENILEELYALEIDTPLFFTLLLFRNIREDTNAETGWQAVHDKAQEPLPLQPFGFFRPFLPVQSQPFADPLFPTELAGIGGRIFRLDMVTIVQGAKIIAQARAGADDGLFQREKTEELPACENNVIVTVVNDDRRAKRVAKGIKHHRMNARAGGRQITQLQTPACFNGSGFCFYWNRPGQMPG